MTKGRGDDLAGWRTTPFRCEKATNWAGGYRVPMCIRWPGVIRPGTIHSEMFSHCDLIPTFCA
ncbi:sulfatase-like hydrolase/transferase, partial [Staphylococcus aureus]